MKSKIALVIGGLTAGILIALSAGLIAGQVNLPNTFTANTPAVASEVNANFNEVASEVNDNAARLAALEALLAGVTRETINGEPTVRFTGVNVQVVNGAGTTDSANGTGNLIVGYDEARAAAVGSQCSVGTNSSAVRVTNEAECTAAGGTWALNHKSGSHYVVVGTEHNYSRWGGVVVGFRNTSNGTYASVGGGQVNAASFFAASVSGGAGNTASANAASVSGGISNLAARAFSSVSGGRSNNANAADASVSGGHNNVASGSAASVSGGNSRIAVGTDDWVAGSLFEDN